MRKLEVIYPAIKTASDHVQDYTAQMTQILSGLDRDAIADFITLLLQARKKGNNIYFIGNGGSASTATHFTNDLAACTPPKTPPFRAVSLTDNHAVMTAISNDYGYVNVFVKQLESLYSEDDLLVAISASGNSANVLKAVEYAKQRGGITIGLTGFDGGKLKDLADHVIHVPTANGEYGPVEDTHLMINHLIGTYLRYIGCDESLCGH